MENFLVDVPIKFGLEKRYGYGTAGFRLDAGVTLETIVKVCGIVACLRSKSVDGKGVGLMITASHNPKHQNGVKIVEPNGDMLTPEWEKVAEEFVNVSNEEEYRKILTTYSEVLPKKGCVWVGYDTRPTSPTLCDQLIEVMNIQFRDSIVIHNLGCCSTPQLHFMVYSSNLPSPPPKLSVDLYYETISKNFLNFQRKLAVLSRLKPPKKRINEVLVDCACAVGSKVLEDLQKYIDPKLLTIKPFNTCTDTPEYLNDGCGSDYVSLRQYPREWDSKATSMFTPIDSSIGSCWSASFDGDADRVILFFEESYMDQDDQIQCQILNGDKISSLLARFFIDVLKKSKLLQVKEEEEEEEEEVTIGAVQTSYANGSSTQFLTKLLGGEKYVACVPTGVKHLHHKAKEFSIGIYFEANGHGTVLFKDSFKELVKKKKNETSQEDVSLLYLELLESMIGLINPAVGDAVSDLLAIISCMNYLSITSIHDWNNWYQDLPNLLTKVKVRDRSVIKTCWNETKVLEPKGIQQKIDSVVDELKDDNVRCFVRPSGTEDVVRVYSEATDMSVARKLSRSVEKIVRDEL